MRVCAVQRPYTGSCARFVGRRVCDVVVSLQGMWQDVKLSCGAFRRRKRVTCATMSHAALVCLRAGDSHAASSCHYQVFFSNRCNSATAAVADREYVASLARVCTPRAKSPVHGMTMHYHAACPIKLDQG